MLSIFPATCLAINDFDTVSVRDVLIIITRETMNRIYQSFFSQCSFDCIVHVLVFGSFIQCTGLSLLVYCPVSLGLMMAKVNTL